MAFYETATAGKRAIKVPLMTLVHREAKIIEHERKIRLDQLRELIRCHAGDPAYFRMVCAWRREMIDLYERY